MKNAQLDIMENQQQHLSYVRNVLGHVQSVKKRLLKLNVLHAIQYNSNSLIRSAYVKVTRFIGKVQKHVCKIVNLVNIKILIKEFALIVKVHANIVNQKFYVILVLLENIIIINA